MIRSHPKRLTPPAAPGALLKDLTAQARAISIKREGERDAAYLEKVRLCPFLACEKSEAHEAAHVRYASAAFGKASGLQKKPEDRWALPVCSECHTLARHAQHRHNEEAWWIAVGINPLIVATRLWEKRGDLDEMRKVVMVAIAERSKRP